MKDRIRQLMESQHMTQQVFAQFLEMSPASLSSIFNDRTRPTLNIVEAIKKKIPNVNTDWLMFGVGEVYMKTDEHGTSNEVSQGAGELGLFDVPDTSVGTLNFDTPRFDNHPSQPAPLQQHQRKNEVLQEVKIVERQQRKVTEIRVYYDDLTYETFVPSKKI